MKRILPALILALAIGFYVKAQPADPPGNTAVGDSTVVDSLSADSTAIADTLFVPPDSMALIPGGDYVIGYKKGLYEQKPVHTVTLSAFLIDIHEVTNAQYKKFLEAAGHCLPFYWDDTLYNHPNKPVIGLSWYDAEAYCQWAGKRLPTEAEWEAASRGGLEGEKYPFDGRINSEKVNYRFDRLEDPKGLSIIGQYPPNGYGLYDMAGNAYEWCNDWFSKTAYRDTSSYNNPRGPAKGEAKVMRGGAWNYGEDFQQVFYRNRAKPDIRANYIGFRCAKDAE